MGVNKVPAPMVWTAERRQAYAIARSRERTRAELAPARAKIDRLIKQLGWRRARPLVVAALGWPVQRKGLWALGRIETRRVLDALTRGPAQPSLWDRTG
jgi:hypothetical protein